MPITVVLQSTIIISCGLLFFCGVVECNYVLERHPGFDSRLAWAAWVGGLAYRTSVFGVPLQG